MVLELLHFKQCNAQLRFDQKNLVLLVLHAHIFLRTRLVGGKLNEQVRHSRQSRRLYSLTYLIGGIHKLRTQGGGVMVNLRSFSVIRKLPWPWLIINLLSISLTCIEAREQKGKVLAYEVKSRPPVKKCNCNVIFDELIWEL